MTSYVTKAQHDALMARVAALEGKVSPPVFKEVSAREYLVSIRDEPGIRHLFESARRSIGNGR